MSTGSEVGAVARPDGTVTGSPRRWLRLEGGVLLAAAAVAYPAGLVAGTADDTAP